MSKKTDVSNRTKIVVTLGPASGAKSTIKKMIRSGMDVARINFSHGTADLNLELLSLAREAAREEGLEIAVIQDLQGSKLRIGDMPRGGLQLIEGSTATMRAGVGQAEDGVISVPYEHLHEDVRRGDRILLNDGLLELEVISINGRKIVSKVLLGGRLLAFQGLSVPSRELKIESLTEKDEEDLALGLQNGVDFIALSFVRTVDDVVKLRGKIDKLLPRDAEPPQIIVKIEKHEAVDNFDEILEETDGVMVARGDLGLDTSVSAVPVAQKELVAKCLIVGKPVIVATHMLSSMITRPRPSRAEASDVANAVIDHTDAVMLSEETAMGRYPVRTVETMSEIIEKTEESSLDNLAPERDAKGYAVPLAVAASAVAMSRQIDAAMILVTTKSGYSARVIARFRPEIPVVAVTSSAGVQRQLLLSWGVTSLVSESGVEPERMAKAGLKEIKDGRLVGKGDKVVVVSGLRREGSGYDSGIRIVEIY